MLWISKYLTDLVEVAGVIRRRVDGTSSKVLRNEKEASVHVQRHTKDGASHAKLSHGGHHKCVALCMILIFTYSTWCYSAVTRFHIHIRSTFSMPLLFNQLLISVDMLSHWTRGGFA